MEYFFLVAPQRHVVHVFLVGDKVEFVERKSFVGQDGRFIILYCEIQGQPFLLVNVYAPNQNCFL